MKNTLRYLLQTVCLMALLIFTPAALAAAPVSTPYSTLPPSPVENGVFQRGDAAMPVILDVGFVS